MVKRLQADGHDVGVVANHGLAGRPMRDPETGIPVFPSGADAYGNDVLLPSRDLHQQGEPGWIITLYDVWVFGSPMFDTERIASWTPVDHYPVPPKVAEWCRKHPIIAMSRFGQRALQEAGVDAMYAPHALDLDVWKPTPLLNNGQTPRQAWGIPEDAFLIMVNAANKGNVPPRKSWGEMMSAIALLMRERDDVYLYVHTELRGVFGGVDLQVLMAALDIPAERVRVPDQFANLTGLIPQQVIAAYYTAADVLLATSMGEGFGIPVIEAQACGTPVIVTDFSAQPELVGAGWTVPYQPWWDFTQAAWLALPNVQAIVSRLRDAIEAKGQLTEAALAKAREYEADAVYAEHWRPILATLEAELHPPTRQQRRAKRRAAA
jgi:glycosyltransferase involved in cell wall biosynthesis